MILLQEFLPIMSHAHLHTLFTNYMETLKPSDLIHFLNSVNMNKKYQLLSDQCELGLTAVHGAAARGDTRLLRCMIQSLTAHQLYNLLKIQSSGGSTAVHCAAVNGHTKATKVIIDQLKPAQLQNLLTMQDCWGRTAMDYAVKRNHPATAECLGKYLRGEL